MIILVEDIKTHDALTDADIFFRQAFYKLHAQSAKTYYLGLAKGTAQQLIGAIQIILDGNEAKTPIRGTYGGIYLSPKNFSLERAEEALQLVETWLRKKNITSFSIVLPPFALSSHTQVWVNILLRHGFQITASDLDYAITINTSPFAERVNYACLKKLKQLTASNLIVRELTTTEYQPAHHLITQNREKKGRRFSMDWPSIQTMYQTFPTDFKMIGAFKDNILHAASIFLQINAETIYVFAWGDDGLLQQLAPTTLLAKYLYEYCQQHHCKILDLGVSTEAGLPNIGLINYKLSLGAEASLKLTMSKQYDS